MFPIWDVGFSFHPIFLVPFPTQVRLKACSYHWQSFSTAKHPSQISRIAHSSHSNENISRGSSRCFDSLCHQGSDRQPDVSSHSAKLSCISCLLMLRHCSSNTRVWCRWLHRHPSEGCGPWRRPLARHMTTGRSVVFICRSPAQGADSSQSSEPRLLAKQRMRRNVRANLKIPP